MPLDAAGFVTRETNGALRERGAVAEALLLLHEAGLPLHDDTPKNWDHLLAVLHAVRATPRDALVLDAGAETYSAFLPALARCGFSRLLGVNLTLAEPRRQGPVELRFGNIECLDLPDRSVGYAACLSVIEHGVDLPRFFAEMARVLVPGGLLFVSTDYWGPGLDTAGVEAYGTAFRPFDAAQIVAVAATAAAAGLRFTGPIRTETVDKVVHWRRKDLRYTFHNMLLQAPAPA